MPGTPFQVLRVRRNHLEGAHGMDSDPRALTVRVSARGKYFAWELYFFEKMEAVRFSGPIYTSEEKAKTAGEEACRMIVVKHEKKRAKRVHA
jgi:hypothetical protein